MTKKQMTKKRMTKKRMTKTNQKNDKNDKVETNVPDSKDIDQEYLQKIRQKDLEEIAYYSRRLQEIRNKLKDPDSIGYPSYDTRKT